jgi:DNA-binding MarR family transcriptional regulator
MLHTKRPTAPIRKSRTPEASAIIEHPDLDKVGYLCRRVCVASLEYLQEAIPDLDMNSGQLGTLVLIACNPGITPTEICRAIGREKPTVTSAIDHLERKKLVTRKLSQTDRRSFTIRLTATGRKFYELIKPSVTLADEKLTSCLDPRERATLIALLHRIYENEC